MTTSEIPSVSNATAASSGASSRAGKYLTFFLAGEEYGLEIMKVSEIIGMQTITRIPRTPDFVRGVINLRGRVIPITDLRRKFGMPNDHAAESCIIVVQISDVQTGLVVDRVSDVVAVAEADIEDSPAFCSGVRSDLLLGIGKAGDKVKLLLNIDKVLSAGELVSVSEASAQAA
ncbi:MAG: chemotaxis protein CheW [Gemmatimonadaceae bacterium]